jgi:hypothetical protein
LNRFYRELLANGRHGGEGQQRLRSHRRRADLPRIRFHDLRHSYATAALEAGEDLKVVRARWATPGTRSRRTCTCTSSPTWTKRPPTGWRATFWARVSKALADQGGNAC